MTDQDHTPFRVEKLPKGSKCTDYKAVPSRSTYHDSDEVDRCSKYSTPGSDGDDDRDDRDRKPAYRDEDGNFTDDQMRNAFYWAAQARGWMIKGPNAGIGGTYCVEIKAGKPIIVLDESWNKSNAKAITDSLRDHGFPPTKTRDLDDEIRIFIEPTDDRLKSNYVDNWKHIDTECTAELPKADRPDREPEPEPEPEPDDDGGDDVWPGTVGKTVDGTEWRRVEPEQPNSSIEVVAQWETNVTVTDADSATLKAFYFEGNVGRPEGWTAHYEDGDHDSNPFRGVNTKEAAAGRIRAFLERPANERIDDGETEPADDVNGWEKVRDDPPRWEADVTHPLRGTGESFVEVFTEEWKQGIVWGHRVDIHGFREFDTRSSEDKAEAIDEAERFMRDNSPSSYEFEIPDEIDGWETHTRDENEVSWRAYAKPTNEPNYVQKELRIWFFESTSGTSSDEWRVKGEWINQDGEKTNTTFRIDTLPDKSSISGRSTGTKDSFPERALERAVGYATDYMEENPEQLVDYDTYPKFSISTANKHIKPIFDVIDRIAPEGKFSGGTTGLEVDGEGAIDLRGVDGSNVAMYNVSLLLASMDTASIDREGDEPVAFDGKPLASAVTDVKMSETVGLRTRYNDEQNVPPELVFSRDGNDVKSVYLSSRLHRDPDVPDLRRGASFDGVTAGHYKKMVRGVGKINDETIALVVSPDEAYLVTERALSDDDDDRNAERGRASLTDDESDIIVDLDRDRYAVFLSYDWLRTMTLAPFRPASTEIRTDMTAPERIDDDAPTTGPVRFSWETRGGPVMIMVAPRVAPSDSDTDEWDLSTTAPEVRESRVAQLVRCGDD